MLCKGVARNLSAGSIFDMHKRPIMGLLAGAGERPLYQVLEQQPAQMAPGQIMGTEHTYVVPPTADASTRRAANTRQ